MLHVMKLETSTRADLIPYVINALTRMESQVNQIAASISEFGCAVPMLVYGGNSVIAGHGRLLAADELGLDEVPVTWIEDLTDAQAAVRGYFR